VTLNDLERRVMAVFALSCRNW